MSTTIAVALITSLSTLTGATISALITVSVTRSQGKAQIELSKVTMAQEKLDKQAELRRNAYISFLNQFSTIEKVLKDAWGLPCQKDQAEHIPLFSSLAAEQNALTVYTNTISVEGPHRVELAGMRLYEALIRETTALIKISTQSRGQEGTLAGVNDELHSAVTAKTNAAKAKFIEEVQVALEIPSPITKLRQLEERRK